VPTPRKGYNADNIVAAFNARVVDGKIQMQIGAEKGGAPVWVDSIGAGETRARYESRKTGVATDHPRGKYCAEQQFIQYYIPDATAEEIRDAGMIGRGRAKIDSSLHLTSEERTSALDLRIKTAPIQKARLDRSSIKMEDNPTPFPDEKVGR